jgi:hypothetical protein
MSTNPEWMQQPAQPAKGGGGLKILLIILGVVGGLALLACCGGVIGFGVWAGSAESRDPTEIRERTSAIVDVSLPGEFTPVASMSMMGMDIVAYSGPQADSGLELSQTGGMSAANDPEQMRFTFHATWEGENLPVPGGIQPDHSTHATHQVNVRGNLEPFEFVRGTSSDGTQMWEVTGRFQGKGGRATLVLCVPTSEWDEARIKGFLESIQ